jgi:hypothetical protein
MKRWVGVAAVMGLLGGWAGAQTAPKAGPASEDGLSVIMAYAGEWKIQGERFATPHSDAGKEDTTLRNDCWRSGSYIACNQYVDGESKVLLVFTCNEKDKTYTSYQIPQGGGEPGSSKVLIAGNAWMFPWETTSGTTTTKFRVVFEFAAADHINYRQEFSTDGVQWTLMAKGTEIKTGGK